MERFFFLKDHGERQDELGTATLSDGKRLAAESAR
jgi:hypothetical protein